MVRLLESRASALLRLKEEELTRAGEATAALEERLRQSEAENRAWQCLAREAEVMAQALTEALRQVRDSPIAAASRCEGSFSGGSAGGGGGDPEGEEEERARWRREAAAIRRCRGCGSEDLQVLFLPCMHLSTCNLCGPLLPACPVCKSVKQDTIEVFLP
ncbi:unnamed protein product [Spirodela intermedia]|uniref:Uncharacterized protein n=1 Tax=Spirodela intermedia TaxID=51605 RepID=A0A7I8JVN1_SPIIN|nr:unnamed protein product [Spirodela intermedia]CAA6673512.1 unnamed protein product [Spirodela intermedia]